MNPTLALRPSLRPSLRPGPSLRAGLLLALSLALWLASAAGVAPAFVSTVPTAASTRVKAAGSDEICHCAHCPGGAKCCCCHAAKCPAP